MERTRLDPSPGRRRPSAVAGAPRGARARSARAVEQPLPTFNTALWEADARRRRQELDRALAEVDAAADALRRSPSDRTLFDYRQAVRRVLQLALPGSYRVERQTRTDPRGVRRLQVLVRQIDEELDRLAQEVLRAHRDQLALAARLVEIRGLLLDLVR